MCRYLRNLPLFFYVSKRSRNRQPLPSRRPTNPRICDCCCQHRPRNPYSVCLSRGWDNMILAIHFNTAPVAKSIQPPPARSRQTAADLIFISGTGVKVMSRHVCIPGGGQRRCTEHTHDRGISSCKESHIASLSELRGWGHSQRGGWPAGPARRLPERERGRGNVV